MPVGVRLEVTRRCLVHVVFKVGKTGGLQVVRQMARRGADEDVRDEAGSAHDRLHVNHCFNLPAIAGRSHEHVFRGRALACRGEQLVPRAPIKAGPVNQVQTAPEHHAFCQPIQRLEFWGAKHGTVRLLDLHDDFGLSIILRRILEAGSLTRRKLKESTLDLSIFAVEGHACHAEHVACAACRVKHQHCSRFLASLCGLNQPHEGF
mmetsp:Transcript_28999/g.42596  ORF Transcript_28999/g.42596 Transcript_28999/m.42596 type:complete len:206 (+) Transcript_28999:861-1478(+)